MYRYLSGLVLIAVVLPPVFAADKDDKKVPFPLKEAAPKKDWEWDAPKKDWEWDEDERFDELMEQLAINEASLDAVEAAVAKKTRRKSGQQSEAKRQEANTSLMNRKGGGPMKWDEFYGTNAEKFFYHPVDPNTTYRTDTFLRQMGKAEDDKSGEDTPSRQSVPVHQRPPQWDYIYRANKTARDNALADASIAESEIERLEQRRTALEQEQAALWCKLAFRAVQRLNMARKPVLRFQLLSAAGGDVDVEHTKALSAAARFLVASLAVVEKAEQDQSVAFGGVAAVVTQARESFEDHLLEVPDLEPEWESTKTDLGKFYELSQMLADKAKTLAESYKGAMDGDMNREAARKERFRGMLQESVVEYAQILLAMNELTDKMKTEWRVRVDTKQKLEPLQVVWEIRASGNGSPPETTKSSGGKPPPPVKKGPKVIKKPMLLSFRTEQEIEKHWTFTSDEWRLENSGVRLLKRTALDSKESYIGDFTVEIQYSRHLLVSACGIDFGPGERGVEEGTHARLQRRDDVLTFQTNKSSPRSVTLKQSQKSMPTRIHIGTNPGVGGSNLFIQAVQILGTVEDAE